MATKGPLKSFVYLLNLVLIPNENPTGLKLHQMDVTCAFLNGELEEEIYMRQPQGSEVKGKEDLVCKLRRSIYCLKQSTRSWNTTLDGKLKRMGFSQTKGDPCIYTAQHGEPFIVCRQHITGW